MTLILGNSDALNLGEYIKDSLTDIQYGGYYDNNLVTKINTSNGIIRDYLRKKITNNHSNSDKISVGGGIIDVYFDDGHYMDDATLLNKISKMSNNEINTLVGGNILKLFTKNNADFDKFISEVDKVKKSVEAKLGNFNMTTAGVKSLVEDKYKALGEYFKLIKYKIILERASLEPVVVADVDVKQIYDDEIEKMQIKIESVTKKLDAIDTTYNKTTTRGDGGIFSKILKMFGIKKHDIITKLNYILGKDQKAIINILKQYKELQSKIIDIKTKKSYYILYKKEDASSIFKQYKKAISDYEKNKERYDKLLDFASSSKMDDIEQIQNMKTSLQLDLKEYQRLFADLNTTKTKSQNLLSDYEKYLSNLFENLFIAQNAINNESNGLIPTMTKLSADIRKSIIFIKKSTYNKSTYGSDNVFNMLLSTYECILLYSKSNVKYLKILDDSITAIKESFLELLIPKEIYKQAFQIGVAFETVKSNISKSLMLFKTLAPLLPGSTFTGGGKKQLMMLGGVNPPKSKSTPKQIIKPFIADYLKTDYFNVVSLNTCRAAMRVSYDIEKKTVLKGGGGTIDILDDINNLSSFWVATSKTYVTTALENLLDNTKAEYYTTNKYTASGVSDSNAKEFAVSIFVRAKNAAIKKAKEFTTDTAPNNKHEKAIRQAAINVLKEHNIKKLEDLLSSNNSMMNIKSKNKFNDYESTGDRYYDFMCFQDTGECTSNKSYLDAIVINTKLSYLGYKHNTTPNSRYEDGGGKMTLMTVYNKEKYDHIYSGIYEKLKDVATPGTVTDVVLAIQFSLFKYKDKIGSASPAYSYNNILVININSTNDENSSSDPFVNLDVLTTAIKDEYENKFVSSVPAGNTIDYPNLKIILAGTFNNQTIEDIIKTDDKNIEITLHDNSIDNKFLLYCNNLNIDKIDNLEQTCCISDTAIDNEADKKKAYDNIKSDNYKDLIFANDENPNTYILKDQNDDNPIISDHLPVFSILSYDSVKELYTADKTKIKISATNFIRQYENATYEDLKQKLTENPIDKNKARQQTVKDKLSRLKADFTSKKGEIDSESDPTKKAELLKKYLENDIKDIVFDNDDFPIIQALIKLLNQFIKDPKILTGGSMDFTKLISNNKHNKSSNHGKYNKTNLSGGAINTQLDALSKIVFNVINTILSSTQVTNLINPGASLGSSGSSGMGMGSPGPYGMPSYPLAIPGGISGSQLQTYGYIPQSSSGAFTGGVMHVPGMGISPLYTSSSTTALSNITLSTEILDNIMLNELASGYTKFNNDILIPFVNNIDLIINNMGNLEAIEIDPIKNKKLPDIKQNFATKLKEIRTNLFETKKIPGDRIVKANKALSDAISKNDEIAKQALSVLGVNDNNILVKLSGWMDAQQQAKPTYKQADDNLRDCFNWLNNDTNLDKFIDQLVNIRYKDNKVAQYNILNGLKRLSGTFVNFKSPTFLNTIKQLESDQAVIAQKPKQSTPQTPQAAAQAAAKISTSP